MRSKRLCGDAERGCEKGDGCVADWLVGIVVICIKEWVAWRGIGYRVYTHVAAINDEKQRKGKEGESRGEQSKDGETSQTRGLNQTAEERVL